MPNYEKVNTAVPYDGGGESIVSSECNLWFNSLQETISPSGLFYSAQVDMANHLYDSGKYLKNAYQYRTGTLYLQ
jgi:hypothetical protein